MVDCFSKLRCLSCVLSLTLLVTNPVWADDTEIFFGRSSNAEVQPNVLFVLDGSGSMTYYDCSNGDVRSSTCGDGTLNGTTSRLARLKDALKTVLHNTSDVNVGLMRFSGTDSGGRVTYPVLDIDQQICGGEPCGDDTEFTAQSRTAASSDDAVQHTDGNVVIDEAAISLTKFEGIPTENQWIGFRFPELQIPQGATITDARLEFASVSDNDSVTNLTIHSEDAADSQPYTAGNNKISQRNRSYNTVSWNAIPAWDKDGNYESPNIAGLIQPVVSKTGWCGGQALGLVLKGSGERTIAAFDSGSGTSPKLRVSYKLDQVSASGGCTTSTLLTRVSSAADDATELRYGGSSYGTGLTYSVMPVAKSTYYSYGYDSATRFSKVYVPKNATILDASITLVTKNYGWFSNYPTLKVSAHDSANPAQLQSRNGNISDRPETSAVDWTNIPTASGTKATTPSLTGMVQSLVNKSNWDSGNPMVFMFKQNGSGGHNFVSYDGNPSQAAQLRIVFESQIQSAQDKINGPVTDVRSEIIAEIDSMVASGNTPTVGAMLEARRYFSGQNVRYGLNRYDNSTYADSPYYWGRYSRVSTPSSYTGGTVVRHNSCNTNAPDGKYCSTENITGQPVYISPFTHECQSNHIVLLTDGQPTADATAASRVTDLVPGGCVDQPGGKGTCGEEIAEYMSTNDQHTFGGDQFITTHTIGFNFTTQWLRDIAASGGGGYYTADTADQLSSALANIIDSVQDGGSSFVAPGATVDNFSKVSHRNDIYLALFQPKATPDWDGNLKRYDFTGNPAVLHDSQDPPQPAIDPATGKFFDEAKSHWSLTADGNAVTQGGASGRITPTDRNVYTYTGSSEYLTHDTNAFKTGNALITVGKLGLSSGENTARANIMNWAIGHDIKDEDGDNNLSEPRHHIGDPLHSRPVIITYGGDSDEHDSVIFFGTNDGFLHAIDTDTGDEVFSFIPSELIPNLKPLYESNPATNKIYGLDGAMSLWTEDKNYNGSIDAEDHVYLYAGMRRGGRTYYALDVTDKDSPTFKWQISNITDGFSELGQTWSQAMPTTINYLGTKTKVIVFGGGYDTDQDDHVTRTVDDIGRAIYIVDADDGELLWSGGPASGSETKSFDDMTYSFPATPIAVDANGDGTTEQIYIGDMGGRIWRFDINEDTTEKTELVDGGIIADMGSDGVIADNRRFYHTPDISVSNIDGKKVINIAVGSGYQAHPLDTAIEDRFYLIRYPFDSPVDADGNPQYGIRETTVTGNENGNSASNNYSPISESHLFDATSNVIGEGTDEQIAAAELALSISNGWYIKMEQSGEKVLGSSVTFDNKVLFASYVPGGTPTGCAPEIGHGIFWAVNLWDATPVAPLDGSDENNLVKADRNKPIPGGGIPAPVQTLFIESGSNDSDIDDKELQILAISGANSLMTLDSRDLVQRVYWSEYPNF